MARVPSRERTLATQFTRASARRIALAAQAFTQPHGQLPSAERVTATHIMAVLRRIHLLQIDSVNVLSRSHYLPVFSRLGPYDRAALDRLADRAPRRLMEYWAHEASYIRPEHFADLRVWQRRRWVGLSPDDAEQHQQFAAIADRLVDLLGRSRPMTAGQIAAALDHAHVVDRSSWGWNWTPTKRVLEDLFEKGVVGSAGRTPSFERRYTLIDSVLPRELRYRPAPDRDDAADRLTEAAARALGVATTRSVRDYFRMPAAATADALARLAAVGVVEPVTVAGVSGTHWLHTDARRPRRVSARALLSPFDSLVFDRTRTEQLFDFHYRIGIYTPRAQREHGYYVLPFLLGERLVARVDVKADRQRRVLVVPAAFAEPGAPAETATELAAELTTMAGWLDLDAVQVGDAGDLAGALRAALP